MHYGLPVDPLYMSRLILLWHVGDVETSTLLMVQRRLSLPVWTILVNTWSICQGCRLLSVALSVRGKHRTDIEWRDGFVTQIQREESKA